MADLMRQVDYATVVAETSGDLGVLVSEIRQLFAVENECAMHIAARVAAAQQTVWAMHGGKQVGWTQWVRENLPFGVSQAKSYLRVHRELSGRAPRKGLSLRAALALLDSEPKVKRPTRTVSQIQDDVIDAATVLGDVFSLPTEDAYSRWVACDALAKALTRAAQAFKAHADSEVADA